MRGRVAIRNALLVGYSVVWGVVTVVTALRGGSVVELLPAYGLGIGAVLLAFRDAGPGQGGRGGDGQ